MIRREAHDGVSKVIDEFFASNYDLIVLDEILISVRDGYLEEERLLDLIVTKPETVELVLTGRGATEKVIALADYVSEVKCVKHPYEKGVQSREGIEF